MSVFRFLLAFAVVAAYFPAGSIAQAQQNRADRAVAATADGNGSRQGTSNAEDDQAKFLRVCRDKEQEPIALETSVTRFAGKNSAGAKVIVDLVGAVHVGERDYYEQLNKLFASYDAVLYELVAPEGTRIERGKLRSSRSPVSYIQNLMKKVLKLEFQLDQIDYTKPNMVHADMTPKEFSQSMKDRNESFLKMFFKLFTQAMTMQAKQKNMPNEAELLVALVATDRDYRLKRMMADQFENMEKQLAAINGPDGSTIITQRNKKALQVLRQQLAKGKRRLAVFYGAGHLSDMAQRLKSDFGMRQQSQRWLVAWSITPPVAAGTPPAVEDTSK